MLLTCVCLEADILKFYMRSAVICCDVQLVVGCFSLPAPGHFNDDNNMDFLLHLNHGVYPDYDYSMVGYTLCLMINIS